MNFFVIFSMVSGLLVQLQAVKSVISDKSAKPCNNCSVTHALALIYPRLLAGFGTLFFFVTSSLAEFQVGFWHYHFIT